MNITVLVEGVVMIVISLVVMTEGFRLIIYKDPQMLYDVVGPGLYLIMLSIGPMTIGVVHIIVNYRKSLGMEKISLSKEMRIKVISMVAVFIIYLFLINITGYLVATIIFFFLEFRAAGVKSWRTNFIMTLICSASYYLIFTKYFVMVFPKGVLFK